MILMELLSTFGMLTAIINEAGTAEMIDGMLLTFS